MLFNYTVRYMNDNINLTWTICFVFTGYSCKLMRLIGCVTWEFSYKILQHPLCEYRLIPPPPGRGGTVNIYRENCPSIFSETELLISKFRNIPLHNALQSSYSRSRSRKLEWTGGAHKRPSSQISKGRKQAARTATGIC